MQQIGNAHAARAWGLMPGVHVQQDIELAHQRSAAFGLERQDPPDYASLGKADLQLVLEQNRLLFRHAAPVMDSLYEQIVNTHHMVVLTDARGLILHTLGDADFLEKADQVALNPGVAWSEQSKGTNAIGTAIAAQTPTVIHADQHYLFANQFLTCSASPIFDAQGQVIGVLDVTGDQHHFHRHTMALVRMSAQMIENQMFSAAFQNAVKIHFHSRPEFLGTLMEGIACFTPDGRFLAASRSALFQLGLPVSALQTHTFSSLFGMPLSSCLDLCRRSGNSLITLALPNGMKVHAQCHEHPRTLLSAGVNLAADRTVTEKTEQPAAQGLSLQQLAGGDAQVAALINGLRKVIDRGIPLMITGETGTGKDWLAQAIHQASARRHGPFVAVNCAAIPESLIESELFGYEEGAFTGARKKGSRGKLLQANGGTLFLDEIGDMPLHLQARLLRVLQERSVTPLGGAGSTKVDIDIICATNQPLKQMIATKQFREDLYYRLNGYVLKLPALRDRSDLTQMVSRILQQEDAAHMRIHPALMQVFERHPWPGNIRQLSNLLRTALRLAEGESEIGLQHCPQDFLEDVVPTSIVPVAQADLTPPLQAPASDPGLAAQELGLIQQALAQCKGNVTATARMLGISRNTIYRKLGRG